MELLLKNISEEHLPLLAELAKTLHFEILEPEEDDAWYFEMMEESKKEPLLSEEETVEFMNSLRSPK